MPSQSAIWFATTAKRFGGWQECVQHLSRFRNQREPALHAPSPELLADRRETTQKRRERTGHGPHTMHAPRFGL